ncbi:Uncharacterised protein [BD1-7 clade bacterium]|uniref:DUF1456 family protein n=1 Tax=BD1-7 clade bacterium TaxID=2029982 RepID=A0A5S9PLB0_9GAMM|nr:Uncharacterised protein [BD1-7 clade bacterium]
MTNNDILRRLRYIFDISDQKMMQLCSAENSKATRAQISNWMKPDSDDEYKSLPDNQLALFLNNFIELKRGKKDGPKPEPESRLNNNLILMKLKIALNLQADDVLNIMESADFVMSKHELSAFFRRPGHKHYRVCKDQILRRFIEGLGKRYHDNVWQKKED